MTLGQALSLAGAMITLALMLLLIYKRPPKPGTLRWMHARASAAARRADAELKRLDTPDERKHRNVEDVIAQVWTTAVFSDQVNAPATLTTKASPKGIRLIGRCGQRQAETIIRGPKFFSQKALIHLLDRTIFELALRLQPIWWGRDDPDWRWPVWDDYRHGSTTPR
jgi:hypothetical protein